MLGSPQKAGEAASPRSSAAKQAEEQVSKVPDDSAEAQVRRRTKPSTLEKD